MPTMLGAVMDRPPLSKLTTSELIVRLADYAAKAKTARSANIRGVLDRLAARYAVSGRPKGD